VSEDFDLDTPLLFGLVGGASRDKTFGIGEFADDEDV
jgi:hypothetical protein